MIVAAIQHDIVWKDAAATQARVTPLIDHAIDAGASLVLLSEMFATGFSTSAAEISQPPDGPTVEFVRATAQRHGAWIAGSVAVDGPSGRSRNRFIAAGPSGELVTYDKRHPFTFADEHLEFEPGDDVVTFEVDGVRVTPFVCYDLRFADEFWQLAESTDVYLVPANWPESRRSHWMSLLHARAIENQAYVVGCNRVGTGATLPYSGDSRIIDPLGELLATAAHTESILIADVTAERVQEVRDRFRFLQDRR